MSQAGFYELLTGHFADGRPLHAVSERQHLAQSIADHIGRLLNSRQGALRAAPDYGLPDTNLIYANQPAAREQLRAAITQTILRHEPRVAEVLVQPRVAAGEGFVQGFHVQCRLGRGNALIELEGLLGEDGRLNLSLREADANSWSANDV